MAQTWTQPLTGHWIAESGSFTFNSGLILHERVACLIDPGLLPQEIDGIRDFALDRGASLGSIVLTHSHWDHVLGPERLPGVRTIANSAYPTECAERQGRKVPRQVAEWETTQRVERERPFEMPVPDEVFDETMTLSIGGRSLRLLHAPGHAPDQLVVWEPEIGLLWAADMLSDLEIPYVCHSLVAYEETLDRLREMPINFVVPAHGHVTGDPREIRARLDADARYLADLRVRIESALRAGRCLEETVALCGEMRFGNRQENERPHRFNVETAFIELGGTADARTLGWHRLEDDVD